MNKRGWFLIGLGICLILSAVILSGRNVLAESNAEREARAECKNTMFSSIKNIVFRALSVARSSIFVTLRESIDIISAIKIALDFHLIKGITQGDLHALLYRVQNGQLEFVLNNGSFNFEEDIENNSMKKNERLRALVLKEAFENLKLDI